MQGHFLQILCPCSWITEIKPVGRQRYAGGCITQTLFFLWLWSGGDLCAPLCYQSLMLNWREARCKIKLALSPSTFAQQAMWVSCLHFKNLVTLHSPRRQLSGRAFTLWLRGATGHIPPPTWWRQPDSMFSSYFNANLPRKHDNQMF